MTQWSKDEMIKLIKLVTDARIQAYKEKAASYGNLETLQGLQAIDVHLKELQDLIDQVIGLRPERRDA